MDNLTREHEFLSSLILAERKMNGYLIGAAINQGSLGEETFDFGPLYCDKRLRNLFLVAPMMYRALSLQYKALQEFIDLADERPKDSELAMLISSFIDMQNGILLVQIAAQQGVNFGFIDKTEVKDEEAQ